MKKVAMSEDLRYLEQFIADKRQSTHPSDKLLADFIEQNLNEEQKEEIRVHLIECYECREIIININEYGEEKSKANNLIKWSPLILLTASLVLFITLPNKEITLGVIDLSKAINIEYQGADIPTHVNKSIDADKLLEKIIVETRFSNIEFFNEAMRAEKEKSFNMATALYKQALMKILRNMNTKERLKQKIVIHYRLLQIANKNKEKMAFEEYKNILLYELRTYALHYQEKEQ